MKEDIKKKIEEVKEYAILKSLDKYPHQFAELDWYKREREVYAQALIDNPPTQHSLNSDGLEDVVSDVLNIHKEPLLTNDNTEFELSMKELKLIINRFSASQTQHRINSELLEALSIMLNYESATKEEYQKCWKIYQSASQNQQNENPIDWNKLREEFFDECTDNIYCNDGNNKLVVNIAPHDLFNWFKNKIEK